MRRILLVSALVVATLPAYAQEAPPPLDTSALAAERAGLEIPDDVWRPVQEALGRDGRAVGYTSDEMRSYGGDRHLLRSVDNLFRDARAIPRETGRVTDGMIARGADGAIDGLLQRCWGLLDAPAGRRFPRVPRDGWGVDWIEAGATPTEVLSAIHAKSVEESRLIPQGFEPRPFEDTILDGVPAPAARFAARLALGAFEAQRWSWDTPDFVFRMDDMREAIDRLQRDARAATPGPWRDDEYGQSASREHDIFERLQSFDLGRSAYASVILAAHLRTALEEIRETQIVDAPDTHTVELPWGPMVIGGTRDDGWWHEKLPPYTWCVVDLGGNDLWKGPFATPLRGTDSTVSLAVDLGGTDIWDAGDEEFALGCGVWGIGILVDVEGDDQYTLKESGLGCAWFGTGLLWDLAGDDQYTVERGWAQGAAHAGVGVLLDGGGNDTYECAEQSQGLGSTLGTGLLLDLGGDDTYVCRDDGNVSELYLGQSVAMAQGCGYGRRADLGDGRSLAGGWGLLVDAAGNDRYHAQVWAQGAGYWWGVGVLEDRGGDDVYENGKYSSGAAAHFAIGVHVDVSGNDSYNQGVTTTKNQFQGHARDGSIGVFVDGAGDDRYLLRNLCAGGADLASVGLFWDRAGDDVYDTELEEITDWARPPFGSASRYGPFRSFRDDLIAWGVFLDTGGDDTYPEGARASNGAMWTEAERANARAVGIDR
jgi:hypothetical protein